MFYPAARRLGLFLVLGAALALGQGTPTPTPGANEPVVVLPPMTVVGQLLKDYPFFPKSEVTAPDFSPHTPPIDMQFPGQAYNDGVTDGNATVGVELDAEGHPTDFLLIRYTKRYFGDELMREAHRQDYTPRQVKGMAVPGRFNFGTRFSPKLVLQMNSFNAIEERNEEIEGGPRFIYEPHLEKELDGDGLVSVASTVAFIPDGYEPPAGKAVKAIVSFYVDETGRVRLPNVESAASPVLIPNAVKAVSHWAFQPPTVKGKPVLVFTLWSVSFIRYPAATPTPKP